MICLSIIHWRCIVVAVKNRKVTRLQLANDKLRIRFMMWHNKNYNPRYNVIEDSLGIPHHTLSHWVTKSRNLSYNRLELIEQLIED